MISIIIGVVNRKDYLQEAIESAVNQSYPHDKYQIVLVTNFKDSMIDAMSRNYGIDTVFYGGKVHQGKFFSSAIKKSKGDILCFLDDDDAFTLNKLSVVDSIFTDNVAYYHNGAIHVDNSGK